jgi:hypothetical protein
MKNLRFLLALGALVFSILACSFNVNNHQSVEGSGVIERQERTVKTFHAVDIVGSADVDITIGDTQSVTVEADDNILPLIETLVRNGTLIIRTASNTSITPKLPVHVIVAMKSLDAARITGSGNINISDLAAERIQFNLPGSGNISAVGSAERVTVSLGGSGNILCEDLESKSTIVRLNGSGNITVNASESLDVNVDGSGNVRYRGNPANVDQSVAGSGSVVSMP